jgi:hypothetical protein
MVAAKMVAAKMVAAKMVAAKTAIPNSKRFVVIPLINDGGNGLVGDRDDCGRGIHAPTGTVGWSAIAMIVGVGYTPLRGRAHWMRSAISQCDRLFHI